MIKKGDDKFRFTLKSPVHVGNGEKLGPIDVVIERNQCIVVDIESLLLSLQDNKEALNEFGQERFNVTKFLKKYKIAPTSVEKYTIHNPDRIQLGDQGNIQEIIKTGLGNPYIPGSSVKGAIRTVILWHLFNEEEQEKKDGILKKILKSNVKKENADNELDKYLFGHDPNHDFLRVLQVRDVEFKLPDIKLLESKVLSLKSRSSFGWKGFRIYCEALMPGSSSIGILRIDDFLMEEPLSVKELEFSGIKKDLVKKFPEKCNQFAKIFIDHEIEFFESCNMKELVKFYSNLRDEIPGGNGSFFLHLGWGSGWRGMTGNYIDGNTLMKFRKKFDLGKSICPKCGKETRRDKKREGYSFCFACKKSFPINTFPIFPKTRKIAFENGLPRYPFGWIRLERSGSVEDDALVTEKIKSLKSIIKSDFMKNFDEFRLSPSPEHFKDFIEKIKPEETNELDNLSFREMKGAINIGFVLSLTEANVSDEIKKILAIKLLEVIEKKKSWKEDKMAKYDNLKKLAHGN